jgi:hypothetical protein
VNSDYPSACGTGSASGLAGQSRMLKLVRLAGGWHPVRRPPRRSCSHDHGEQVTLREEAWASKHCCVGLEGRRAPENGASRESMGLGSKDDSSDSIQTPRYRTTERPSPSRYFRRLISSSVSHSPPRQQGRRAWRCLRPPESLCARTARTRGSLRTNTSGECGNSSLQWRRVEILSGTSSARGMPSPWRRSLDAGLTGLGVCDLLYPSSPLAFDRRASRSNRNRGTKVRDAVLAPSLCSVLQLSHLAVVLEIAASHHDRFYGAYAVLSDHQRAL